MCTTVNHSLDFHYSYAEVANVAKVAVMVYFIEWLETYSAELKQTEVAKL